MHYILFSNYRASVNVGTFSDINIAKHNLRTDILSDLSPIPNLYAKLGYSIEMCNDLNNLRYTTLILLVRERRQYEQGNLFLDVNAL